MKTQETYNHVQHFYLTIPKTIKGKDGVVTESSHRVAAIAIGDQNDCVVITGSAVSKQDQFCSKTGRSIALNRLYSTNSRTRKFRISKGEGSAYLTGEDISLAGVLDNLALVNSKVRGEGNFLQHVNYAEFDKLFNKLVRFTHANNTSSKSNSSS